MELEAELERVGTYESLSRWEKSELGRDLRRLGLSYGEIMELIPVKKSTLATWCRDVRLTDEQVEGIKERRPPTPGTPRNTQRKRRREVELIQAQAALEALHLADDPFWVAGVSMYWAEGSKTSRRLAMANADPAALRMFKAMERQVSGPRQWMESEAEPSCRQRRTRGSEVVVSTGRRTTTISPRHTSSPTVPVIARTICPMAYAL